MPIGGHVNTRFCIYLAPQPPPTNPMKEIKRKLFSIREAAKVCGIGRTTLQRMTDDGLIIPSQIGENRYHYYDAQNIYNINLLQNLKECGFTKKQLSGLSMSPEEMVSLANQIQDKINMLTFNMANLQSAAMSNKKSIIRILDTPDLICYTAKSARPYSFFEMSKFLENILAEVISKKYSINRYYAPFLSFDLNDFLQSDFISDTYMCTVYIPLVTKANDPDIVTVPASSYLSYTFKYRKGQTRKHLYLLKDELTKRELTPKSNPLIEVLFNPFSYDDESLSNLVMRLSVAI